MARGGVRAQSPAWRAPAATPGGSVGALPFLPPPRLTAIPESMLFGCRQGQSQGLTDTLKATLTFFFSFSVLTFDYPKN